MRGLLLCTAAGVFVVDVVTKSVAVGWAPIFNAADVCVLAGVAALAWRQLAGPSLPHAERYGWDADDRF